MRRERRREGSLFKISHRTLERARQEATAVAPTATAAADGRKAGASAVPAALAAFAARRNPPGPPCRHRSPLGSQELR